MTGSTLKKSFIIIMLKMINDLGWRDLADSRRDTCLMLFYELVDHEVNVPSERKPILTRNQETLSTQYILAYKGSNIDKNTYSDFPKPSEDGTNISVLLAVSMLQPNRIG